jgi:hypothetical protein
MLRAKHRRLGKSVIKRTESAAGDVGNHAVKDLSTALIGVESAVEEFAEESPALRDAETVGALHDRLVVVE